MSYQIHEVRINWTMPNYIEVCCFHKLKMVGIYHYEDMNYMHPNANTVAVFKIKYKS